jgi:hypothetical protein
MLSINNVTYVNNNVNDNDPWSPPSNLPEYAKDAWNYISSRSYHMKYWKILREALANGSFNMYNLSSVYSGELELEDIRVKNNLPSNYQHYDVLFLEKLSGVQMFYRNVPYDIKRPTDDEIMNAITNATVLMKNENNEIAKMKEQEIAMGIIYD